MKLTELKKKIDEALKLHSNYNVKIVTGDVFESNIDSGRFNFNIHVDVSSLRCDEYHIEDDEDMEYCSVCDVYYPDRIECPSCELKEIKRRRENVLQNKEN